MTKDHLKGPQPLVVNSERRCEMDGTKEDEDSVLTSSLIEVERPLAQNRSKYANSISTRS